MPLHSTLVALRALALLLLSPGIGGGLVRALHACHATPGSGGGAMPMAGTHHAHHEPDRPATGSEGDCQCIGACERMALVARAGAPRVVAELAPPAPRTPPLPFAPAPVVVRARMLPPSTAPPLA